MDEIKVRFREVPAMRDPLTPDCAVEHCYYPMTTWDIYCEGHSYLTVVTIERF